MEASSESTRSSPDAATAHAQPRNSKGSRVDRPCDSCRRRKSRCAKEPNQERCVLCQFHHRECTYIDAPQPRKRRAAGAYAPLSDNEQGGEPEARSPRKKSKSTQTPEYQSNPNTSAAEAKSASRSLLDHTLGLHQTTHLKYIGPSSPHEDRLLDLIHRLHGSRTHEIDGKFRRVADGVTFLSRPDANTLFCTDDDQDSETIEQLVRPHGPGLVNLFFRTVHPSYPILHKGVFIEKYTRSYKEFSPPLLAAVYLLAIDWWEYDRDLSSHPKPDASFLLRTAMKALSGIVHRPKLSTVQAGLLLLQRAGGDSWALTSQVVAVGEELGLHLDCTLWDIPDWEKGLRRRLAWAIFMQDKWSSLIHGRPSHIVAVHWRMSQLSLADFPETAAHEDEKEGSAEVEKGRILFIHLARLTQIVSQALDMLYQPDQSGVQEIVAAAGVEGLLEYVKPLAVSLKEWANDMPADLHMEHVRSGKLCSSGYLHLSYFVTEIIIHRHIVRNLTQNTPQPLRELCREAGKARLERAINFVDALRPEHLQAFWWFASPKSLAFIRTYGGLLWATSSSDQEAEFYRRKLADFRWSLKVRAKGVDFISATLREMDQSLQDIDMTQSPIVWRATRGIQDLPSGRTSQNVFAAAESIGSGEAGAGTSFYPEFYGEDSGLGVPEARFSSSLQPSLGYGYLSNLEEQGFADEAGLL